MPHLRTDLAAALSLLVLAACSQSSSTEPPPVKAAPSSIEPSAPAVGGDVARALPFAKIKGRTQTITILTRGGEVRYRVEGERGDVLVAAATLEELRDQAPEAYEIARSAVAGGRPGFVDARVDLPASRANGPSGASGTDGTPGR